MRHRKLADCDLDFHAGVVDRTEHFDDAPDWLHVALRLLDDLRNNDLSVLGSQRRPRRNQNVMRDALVLRGHDRYTTLVQQAPDQPIRTPFNHFDDFTFRAAAPILSRDARENTITVQYLGHFVFRQQQILPAVVSQQKTVALTM